MEPRLWQDDERPVRRLSLVRLSAEIARSVGAVGRVEVEGEVVRPTNHPGGTYFTLRDRAAQISVRCPANRVSRCRVVAGERVMVVATVAWVPERGQLQLMAEEVSPVGEGAIAAAISERRARLAEEGLLDRPRRPIPRLPHVIGVICGAEAAVRNDVESVVAARFPGYPVTYHVTNVSGPGAADAVMEALVVLDAQPDVEVIMLARGGGDAAQLLPFSDEELCRAMCRLSTPVVSAIGHDGDRPLCDEVADLRCGTPSLAATLLVPSRVDLERELDSLLSRAREIAERRLTDASLRQAGLDPEQALQAGLARAVERLSQVSARLGLIRPRNWCGEAAARLERVGWQVPLRSRLQNQAERLAARHRHLEALSPARVLERGYAVVRTGDGAVVRRAGDVVVDSVVGVQLADGELAARVEKVTS